MIVITAPTSDIGLQVLEQLLESGEQVRVIARDPSRLPAQTRERVEIVKGSHGEFDVLTKALKGAESLFWLVPPDMHAKSVEAAYVDFSRPACEAIKDQGVRRVVVISGLGRGSELASNAGLITASLAMEDLIASTGVDCRMLTMPSFMNNIARQVLSIKSEGVFFSPISGNLKLPFCATRDIANTAARLLLDSSWSGQGHLAVLGPENLSYDEMARILSEVIGKTVRHQQISYEAHKSNFLSLGMSEAMAKGMADMYAAKNKGIDNVEPRTPENTTPTSFRQWCEEEFKPLVLSAL